MGRKRPSEIPCATCGTVFKLPEQPNGGRPPKYCKDECRPLHYRRRKRNRDFTKKRKSTQRRQSVSLEEDMAEVVEHLARGESVKMAMAKVARVRSTYEKWCNRSPEFAARAQRAVAQASRDFTPEAKPFDAEFREHYFKFATPRHLQKIVDAIDNLQRLAREHHEPKALLVLVPPDFAKSTLMEDWLSHQLAVEPNLRCFFLSKTEGTAKKRVGRIMRRMTDTALCPEFIEDYGPFKADVRIDAKPWTARYLTVFHQNSGERDYSLEAIGIKGHIYNVRADRIVADDIADLENQTPTEIDKQLEYLQLEVRSRLTETGLIVVIGTHIREGDVYTKLMELGFFDEVITMPAITREPETLGKDDPGESLWPERHPIKKLLRLKERTDPRIWELSFQQNPLPSVGAIFSLESIEACYDRDRNVGHIPEKTYVVAGVDPSVSQYTAGVVFAVRQSGMRYLVDAWNEKGLTGEGGDTQAGVVEFIIELCKRYRVRSLAVENYSWSALINNSLTLRRQLHELGVQHFPVRDPGPGSGQREQHALSQLSGLFSYGLINIPAALESVAHLRAFRDQLVTYRPDAPKRAKNDLVKALRWTESAARKYLNGSIANTAPHFDIPDYMNQPEVPNYLDESVV